MSSIIDMDIMTFNIKDSLELYLTNFSKNYPNIADCSNRIEMHRSNFEEKFNIKFWWYHAEIMKNIGLENASKDISILDMGTQFGFIPHFLKEYGFTDVECTNSSIEASEHLYELETVWKEMGVEPYELHILPKQEFVLNKKYDLILATQTNMLWNTNRVVKYNNRTKEISHYNYVVDKEGESHVFFSPYNTEELSFFIENIKKYITPNGIAVIQPFPFSYSMPEFKEEYSLVREHQNIGHWEVTEKRSLWDYFVITNSNRFNK